MKSISTILAIATVAGLRLIDHRSRIAGAAGSALLLGVAISINIVARVSTTS